MHSFFLQSRCYSESECHISDDHRMPFNTIFVINSKQLHLNKDIYLISVETFIYTARMLAVSMGPNGVYLCVGAKSSL